MVREIIAFKDYYREIAKAKRLKQEYYEDKNADI